MLYRVVLQGRTGPDSDPDEVKREFTRVTALPRNVTDQLFDGSVKIIKRQVSEADAERIAQTLRAIGAPATIELEPGSAAGGMAAGNPLAAPTHAPAMAQRAKSSSAQPIPAHRDTSSRNVRGRTLVAVAGGGFLLAIVVAAPAYEDWVRRVRNGPAATEPARMPVAEAAAVPEVPGFSRTTLEGRWRCTDQTTGATTYWRYEVDGALDYYGENLKYDKRPLTGPSVPLKWRLDGNQLSWIYEGRPPLPLTLATLTFERLEFSDDASNQTRCIRP